MLAVLSSTFHSYYCKAVLLCCVISDTPPLCIENFLLQMLQFAEHSFPLTGLIQLKVSFQVLLHFVFLLLIIIPLNYTKRKSVIIAEQLLV